MSHDWSPLAYDDPLAGDPYEVQALARSFADTATEIVNAANRLRSLTEDGADYWQSHAATVFRAKASDLAGKVSKAEARYTAAASAMRVWADALERTHAAAARAVTAAREAQADLSSAQHSLSSAQGEKPTDDTGTARQRSDEQAASRAVSDAQGRLEAARRQFQAAVEDYNDSADGVSGTIHHASDHDGEKDSFWDDFTSWVKDHWVAIVKFTLKWIGRIALVLAITALVLGLFIPGFDALDGILLGLTLAQLAGHVALAATGNGNWLDVGLDIIALATFGAGKAIGSSAEGVVNATRAGVTGQLQEVAARAVEGTFTARVLRFLGGDDIVDAVQGNVARSIEAEVKEIKGEASFVSALKFGSAEVAENLATVKALAEEAPDAEALAHLVQRITTFSRASAALTYSGQVIGDSSELAFELSERYREFTDRFTYRLVPPR